MQRSLAGWRASLVAVAVVAVVVVVPCVPAVLLLPAPLPLHTSRFQAMHSGAIDTEGHVFLWGCGKHGQLVRGMRREEGGEGGEGDDDGSGDDADNLV